MDVDWFYRIILLIFLLILSALFSGSEVALFSIKKNRLRDLEKESTLISRYLTSLLEYPRRLLVTILLGNTIVNVAASIIAVTIAIDASEYFKLPIDLILLIQIFVLTILIILMGEITPKLWATKYPMQFSRVVSIPLYWISVIIYPVSKILTDLIKVFISRIKYDKAKTAILSSELTELADIGIEKGTIVEDEHELIHGLVTFKTVNVREIMTPRVDITAVSLETDFNELMNIITESGHSRIPLFDNNLDNVVGIIYAKDLLPYLSDKKINIDFSLRKIARDAMFVPETKLINELLKEFQRKNMHLGIVVDEYGGTSGLVSLEDILEEIVGEIRDEYDKEEVDITEFEENKYLVLGKTSIDEMNDFFDYNFSSDSDDYDTAGGFIFNNAGSIPKEGFNFVFGDFIFTVKEVSNKRIKKIIVEKLV
ncbi:MAG: metal transporter [Ignavibacteria bacterium RBG_13_36_8]|nr:MAG: metal transporter [Ignavibacteria bacterium RBG_13_36_8]